MVVCTRVHATYSPFWVTFSQNYYFLCCLFLLKMDKFLYVCVCGRMTFTPPPRKVLKQPIVFDLQWIRSYPRGCMLTPFIKENIVFSNKNWQIYSWTGQCAQPSCCIGDSMCDFSFFHFLNHMRSDWVECDILFYCQSINMQLKTRYYFSKVSRGIPNCAQHCDLQWQLLTEVA